MDSRIVNKIELIRALIIYSFLITVMLGAPGCANKNSSVLNAAGDREIADFDF